MVNNYAVIVTYNPDQARLKENLDKLRQQNLSILVIDNGSVEPPRNLLSEDEFVDLKVNKGIAAALNVGMEEAKARGADWVLSLDQDTIISDNLIEEYGKYKGLPNCGALCPRVIRQSESEVPYTALVEMVERCPTAGFFLKVEVWEKAGKYDEWMFIDYVDYDICAKLKVTGYTIYRINTAFIVQELGKLHVNCFFNRLGEMLHYKRLVNFAHVYNHSPLRNYYFVRNALYYMNRYRDYIDLRAEKSHILRWEIKKLVLEPNRLENIRAIRRGIKDYRYYTQNTKRR